jgi:Protein of unknown function (DUF1559)
MSATAGIGVIWLMILTQGGGVGLPLGVPPLPHDPAVSRIAPEECLLYFSSAGMAKADSKSANHTELLFAEPELRHAAAEVEKLIRNAVKEAAKKEDGQGKVMLEEMPNLVKVLLTRPLAIYVAEMKVDPKGPPQFRGGAVVSLGENADKVKAAMERILAAVAPDKAKEVTIQGTTFQQMPLPAGGPIVTWGIKDRYFYLTTGEGEMEAMLKRAGGSDPKWLTELHKQLPVERVSTVGMMNLGAVRDLLVKALAPAETGNILEALGVNGIDRLSGVSGLDKEQYVSRSLVSLKGEPQGLLKLVEQKPLTTADLDLIPRDATFAFAVKFDAAKAYTTIAGVADKIKPNWKEELKGQDWVEQQQQVLDLVFKATGDTWCLFDSQGGGGMFTGVTAVVSIKDADAAEGLQKKLLALVEAAGKNAPDARRKPHVVKFNFSGKTIHVFQSGEKNFPLAPSWCITDKHLIVALYPEAVKAFLARGRSFQSLNKVPEVSTAMGGDGQVVSLSYVDTRRVFDLAYPFLPVVFQMMANEMHGEGIDVPVGLLPSAGSIRRHLRPTVSVLRKTPNGIESVARQTVPGNMGMSTLPITVGLLVPAVQKVRDAAGRMQSSNNLRQIGIAMLNYEGAYGNLPAAYSVDKAGKPLLSWRVHILPFIEQDALYKEFHLDEPWDSAHNKKLIEKMPKIYLSPASAAGPGMTTYLTVRGKDTAFPGDKGVKLSEIPDGTSNTIAVVETSDKKAVIWTKPDDFELNEKNPMEGLLGHWPAGFLAAFCDGSVRLISRSVDPKALKNAFIRNDGNPLPPDFE